MYIYDEYIRFNKNYKNVNEFIYKNRISNIIKYYNENIRCLDNRNKINYKYYKEFEINAIEILQYKLSDPYVPPYRLLLCNDIKKDSFGIHRYGWKYVISNFVNQNYYENILTDHFYLDEPDFEWVAYALEYGHDDYISAKTNYLKNIKYKSQMKYEKMKYIIFDEWLERKYIWSTNKTQQKYFLPFISFIHNPPLYELPCYLYEDFKTHDNIQLLENNGDFLEEKENLSILITLSDFHRKFIERSEWLQDTTIKTLYHPLELTYNINMFSVEKYMDNRNKSVFCIGWWLRKYDIFLKLSCNKTIVIKNNEGGHVVKYIVNEIRKIIGIPNKEDAIIYSSDLIQDTLEYLYEDYFTFSEEKILLTKWNTRLCGYLESEEYDCIFSKNIVFLDVYSSSANNILLECIANYTPILVKNHVSIVEYLGEEYPFYFTNYEDAEKKSQDLGLIVKTHYYIRDMDKSRFSYQYFNDCLRKIIIENL